MSSADWFSASKVLVVAGKGGVGKTTVGAAVAFAAAAAGADVLLVELEGHTSLGSLMGLERLGYEEVEVELGRPIPDGRIRIRQIGPDDALHDYLDRAGLGPVASRLSRSGAMEVVSTAAPGIRDLLTLGKIRQIEQAGSADLIVVDAPATGHAQTFLTAAAGLAASAGGGPVRDQAEQVLELFADADRCQVTLVTLPEDTPVTETIETAYALEDDVGIKLAPVVVNGVWPPIDGLEQALEERAPTERVTAAKPAGTTTVRTADRSVEAARYRLARMADQRAEIERLSSELPLPQVELPFLFTTAIGPAELVVLADALTTGRRAGGR